MKKNRNYSFAAIIFSLLCSVAFAHHSTRGIYQDDDVEITAVVKDWRFINPHPYLVVDVKAADGSVNEWDVSYGGSAVVHLKRQGYDEHTFTPGETIIIKGKPAIAAGVFGILIEGSHPTRADGTPVVKGGSPF